MSEISLPKQLSGPEALDSMLHAIRQKLRMNGRFQSHMAYPGYRAEVLVKFYPAASFIPVVVQSVEVDNQSSSGLVMSETATVEETVEIPVRSPNQVREEADMPTPVLAQDEHGNPVEKWVKRKGGPKKNTAKGGHVNGGEPAVTMVLSAVLVPVDAA